jgi:5'-nucleotidase
MGLVLVDQDGVLADFEQGLLDVFRATHPGAPFIALAERRKFYAREQYPPEWADTIDAIVRTEGFYRDLPAIEYASAALEEMLAAGHDVFLCSSPLTGSRWCVPEKLAWVEQHLGPAWLRRTVITPDKTLVGDRLQPCVLVDDRPTVAGVATPPWTHVIFDAPYNQDERGPRLSSWGDWHEVLEPVFAAQLRERTKPA